ncbi:MAG: hypothetical protein F2873_02420 [Actinobacteria bacterium]|uniref:Unannotated protein n=1 Tax=freshwater metagenome TaxID=449393 RepID=A0A6J6Z1Y7_9ZZZZ|nr:hypothetical protein [Actinomycetota bacterium]MSX80375.1 hypothetical protein [Actinomycetota bacterium]
MDSLVLIARLLTVAVFVVSGGAKLADRDGTRRAVADFGVSPSLVRPVSEVLPWMELGAAALVLVPATAWWGALVSLLLLASFTVAVSVNLGRGRTPECRCFGQLTSSTVGPATLIRNAVISIPVFFLVLVA